MVSILAEAPAGRVVQREGTLFDHANVGILYGGVSGTLLVDAVNYGTTTEVVSWTAPTGVQVFDWGTIAEVPGVPCGGPYAYRLKDNGGAATSSVPFWVGDVSIGGGQSNERNMWCVSSSPPTPHADTKMFSGGSWVTPTGNGLTTRMNAMRAATGVPQGYLDCAIGGSAVLPYGAGANGYWLNPTTGPFQNFQSVMSASWCQCARIIFFSGGEQDATSDQSGTYFGCGMKDLWQKMTQASGNGRVHSQMILTVMGDYIATGLTDANVQKVRAAQLWSRYFCPGIVTAPSNYDLARTDGVHFTAASYETKGRREAQAYAAYLGLATPTAVGPEITGASWASGALTIAVHLAPGSTTLRQASSGTPTGFRFTTDDFVTTMTPTSFTLGADTIAFGLPSKPTAFDYGYGNIAADTHVISDDVFPQGDSLGCPLQPTPYPITIG